MAKKTKEIFRTNLRRLVKNTGRTLAEVAEDCEISLSFLNQLMSGKKSYSQETIDKLCKGLKCTQADLFRGAEPEAPKPKEQSREELLGVALLGLPTLEQSELREVVGIINEFNSARGLSTLDTVKIKRG